MIIRSDARERLAAGALCAALSLVPRDAVADEPPPAAARAENDTLGPLRERFRAGMESYRAGRFAEAIVVWSAIHAELGTEKGYRLAFNIARAYDQLGENSTQAAEHYEAYLKEVANRRAQGEPLEPLVEKQETEAKERLAHLVATKGRIEVRSDGRPVAVRIDDGAPRLAGFVAYVTPGRVHSVTFNAGANDEHKIEVTVALGELVSVAPPKDEAPAVAPPAPPRYETRVERPYGKPVIYVAAGVAAVSTILPIVLGTNALRIKSDYDRGYTSAPVAQELQLQSDYDAASARYYVSLAVSSALAAATIGLAAYWLWGGKELRVPVGTALARGAAIRF